MWPLAFLNPAPFLPALDLLFVGEAEAGLAEVCGGHDLGLHVDGAYGGAGLASPRLRPLFDGIERADSFVVDPHNVVQHVYVTNLNVGRAPADTLRVLDALQTDELCPCNRAVGGETLAA